MTKEKKRLYELIDSVQYNTDKFKVFINENTYIMGCVSANLEFNKFFVYKTIYDAILDLDEKIKKSLVLALDWEYRFDIEKFNPFNSLTAEEKEAIYYTENAVFRTSVLWDLSAQLYNVKYKNNQNPDKVYYNNLFHNDAQGKHPNHFAIDVYTYLSENETESYVYEEDETWKGNHKYISNYRNKMTHRNSPNITTASDYDLELRMPMRYVLKRCIEDYVQASKFIKRFLDLLNLETEL